MFLHNLGKLWSTVGSLICCGFVTQHDVHPQHYDMYNLLSVKLFSLHYITFQAKTVVSVDHVPKWFTWQSPIQVLTTWELGVKPTNSWSQHVHHSPVCWTSLFLSEWIVINNTCSLYCNVPRPLTYQLPVFTLHNIGYDTYQRMLLQHSQFGQPAAMQHYYLTATWHVINFTDFQ